MDYLELKAIIKTRRRSLGLDQKMLGKKLNKKQTTYSYIETNLDKASFNTVISILGALDLTMLIIPSEQLPKSK